MTIEPLPPLTVLPERPLQEPSSTLLLYLKSPALQSLALSCLISAIFPASTSFIIFGATLLTLTRYPQLFHRGFLYEAAIVDMIGRDKLTNFYPPLNHRWWHTISDHLILGAVPLKNYAHHKTLQSLGVKAVCSVLENFEITTETFFSKPVSHQDWNTLDIDHKLFHCVDMQSMDLNNLIETVDWMGDHIMKEEKVYVHCKQGRGRSACAVIGYLIRYQNMTLDQAYSKLLKIRPIISIKPKQRLMLQEFEKWHRNHLVSNS